MKKILLLALFSCSLSFAQAPEGMTLIKNFEDREKHQIEFNHDLIGEALFEFKQAADFYKVDYQAKFRELESVDFIAADPGFRFQVEGNKIYLNSDYQKYNDLSRIIVWQALAVWLGCEVDDSKHSNRKILSAKWEMDDDNEALARRHRYRNSVQKHNFFSYLAEKFPITYKY